MTISAEDAEELKLVVGAIGEVMAEAKGGWPLNKRETMTAFVLMGLTSRMMPSAVTNPADRTKIIDLAVKVSGEVLDKLKNEEPSS